MKCKDYIADSLNDISSSGDIKYELNKYSICIDTNDNNKRYLVLEYLKTNRDNVFVICAEINIDTFPLFDIVNIFSYDKSEYLGENTRDFQIHDKYLFMTRLDKGESISFYVSSTQISETQSSVSSLSLIKHGTSTSYDNGYAVYAYGGSIYFSDANYFYRYDLESKSTISLGDELGYNYYSSTYVISGNYAYFIPKNSSNRFDSTATGLAKVNITNPNIRSNWSSSESPIGIDSTIIYGNDNEFIYVDFSSSNALINNVNKVYDFWIYGDNIYTDVSPTGSHAIEYSSFTFQSIQNSSYNSFIYKSAGFIVLDMSDNDFLFTGEYLVVNQVPVFSQKVTNCTPLFITKGTSIITDGVIFDMGGISFPSGCVFENNTYVVIVNASYIC